MIYDVDSLPDDVGQLKLLIVTLSQANARQQETLDKLVAEMSKQTVYIKQLLEIIYGKKSEKLPKAERSTAETPQNTDSNTHTPTEQGCWAHARRKFRDALKVQPDAKKVITIIGEMYGIERRAKKLTSDKRLIMRQQESLPLLNQVFDWCRENKENYLPKDPLFLACQYALNHEAALRVYTTDGRLAIDNNETERMLRLAAIGRKNRLFFGSANGGKTGCILFTILGSARRHGLNEFEYLVDLLDRLSDLPRQAELFNLLPNRWTPRTP